MQHARLLRPIERKYNQIFIGVVHELSLIYWCLTCKINSITQVVRELIKLLGDLSPTVFKAHIRLFLTVLRILVHSQSCVLWTPRKTSSG